MSPCSNSLYPIELIYFKLCSLGGAIGTGAHGSTIKYNASISAQVVKLTIVDGTGRLQEISNQEDLKSFRLNLGLLGN